jgi:hypothetical protein
MNWPTWHVPLLLSIVASSAVVMLGGSNAIAFKMDTGRAGRNGSPSTPNGQLDLPYLIASCLRYAFAFLSPLSPLRARDHSLDLSDRTSSTCLQCHL